MTFHKKPNLFMRDLMLKVADLERSARFYEQFIGFKVLTKDVNKISFTVDGRQPILTIKEVEGALQRERRMTGLYHVALLLPERKDLAHFFNHLILNDYPFGASDHIVSEALYLNDPDGNGIEIYADQPTENWEWVQEGVTMATKPLNTESLLMEVQETWSELPQDTVIGHLHLQVNELDEVLKFYHEGLGYDIVTQYPGAYFLSTGKYHHHLALNMWAGEKAIQPSKQHVGLEAYSIVIKDEAERYLIKNRLISFGYDVIESNEDVITTDPAGNVIHLVL